MFKHVDKLSRKIYSYLRKILDLNLKAFRLGIWIHDILLDFDWKSFGQPFIITLFRYFTGARLENTWTTNLDYNY